MMGKKVKFANGRFYRGKRRPWNSRGYTDQNGIAVLFKDIPLNDREGTPDYYKDKDGNKVRRTFDKEIRFQRNPTIVLDSVIHENVIRAIRDWKRCVSSKKSDDLPEVKYGWIREIEPEVEQDKQLKEIQLQSQISNITSDLYDNQSDREFDIVCAHFGIVKGSKSNKYVRLVSKAQSDKESFLLAFNEQDELRPEFYDPAIVTLAIAEGVIDVKKGVYFLNDIDLGADKTKIHVKYKNHMGRITAALNEVVNYADKLEKHREEKAKEEKEKEEKAKEDSEFDQIDDEPMNLNTGEEE